jgi:hypothetical protein
MGPVSRGALLIFFVLVGCDRGRGTPDAGVVDLATPLDLGGVDLAGTCEYAWFCPSAPRASKCDTPSCLDHRCVWSCYIGRTCMVGDTELICDPPAGGGKFVTDYCGDAFTVAYEASATCFLDQEMLTLDGDGCSAQVRRKNGELLGTVRRLPDGGSLANFPLLGGYCQGHLDNTSTPSVTTYACPSCELTLPGF